jgi:ribosome maturation protein SDO1
MLPFDVTHPPEKILNKGEVQVGEKEREHDLSALRKELATLVAEKCVDPSTQRPYSLAIIEKAMAEAGFSVKQNKTAKSQVSECIKALQSKLPIQRARMRVRIRLPAEEAFIPLRSELLKLAEKVERQSDQEEWEAVREPNFSLMQLFLKTIRG